MFAFDLIVGSKVLLVLLLGAPVTFLAVTLSSGNGIKLRVQRFKNEESKTEMLQNCNLFVFLERDRVRPEKHNEQPV